MSYKQIEKSREIRLWLGQIVIPAVMVGVTAMSIPGVRETVTRKANDVKDSIGSKFQKKEES